jgi:hypothetical protein
MTVTRTHFAFASTCATPTARTSKPIARRERSEIRGCGATARHSTSLHAGLRWHKLASPLTPLSGRRKSTRSPRVTSGPNQKNSGPSRKNDSASSGRPAATECAVAIHPMIMGASDAKASPTAKVAPTAVPRISFGKISAV